ncbi:MAG: nitric oxide reductase activation protein [Gammaproteobacteria bacterium]|nr:nitric oxide reductase activation protein [Gammaproteobacteria bacterium]
MSKLTEQQIIEQLDEYLEAEFTFIRTDRLARVLLPVEDRHQRFILSWVKSLASTQVELAHQFIIHVVRVLDVMDRQTIEEWAEYTLDVYDTSGLHPAMEVIRGVEQYVELSRVREVGSIYSEVQGVLTTFVHGLSGRELNIEQGEYAYTDSETIYLPKVVSLLESKEENFVLYKAMVTMLWAQTRYGTYRRHIIDKLDSLDGIPGLTDLYHALESIRLEACIKRELPGLYRRMAEIKTSVGVVYPDHWQEAIQQLSTRAASADDSVRWAEKLAGETFDITSCYQGCIRLHEVETVLRDRIEREKALLRMKLAEMIDEVTPEDSDKEKRNRSIGLKEKASKAQEDENDILEPGSYEITLDDVPIAPPETVRKLLTSIQLDLSQIPDEYLTPAGDGEYDPDLFKEPDPDDVWQGTYHEEGAELYDEWDVRRDHYRKNWCVQREKEVKPVYNDFVQKTFRKYQGLAERLRRTFEAMRDEDRLLKRQVNGDDVDIDALVEAMADTLDGSEMTDRLFTQMHRNERNIAVAFMVDMSGSTRGWINDAERESLLLLCEALELLGDRYAVYGFSGNTRKKCELYRVKTFDEKYTPEVQARIAGIEPQDYTRMGVTIRHITKLLKQQEAKTRMLITLSDGKPDDIDHYRGEYGIEDTRKALIEAKYAGIHPFCITIDEHGQDYLPHMYGAVNYTVVDDVAKLPLKVSDIYRRLTT